MDFPPDMSVANQLMEVGQPQEHLCEEMCLQQKHHPCQRLGMGQTCQMNLTSKKVDIKVFLKDVRQHHELLREGMQLHQNGNIRQHQDEMELGMFSFFVGSVLRKVWQLEQRGARNSASSDDSIDGGRPNMSIADKLMKKRPRLPEKMHLNLRLLEMEQASVYWDLDLDDSGQVHCFDEHDRKERVKKEMEREELELLKYKIRRFFEHE